MSELKPAFIDKDGPAWRADEFRDTIETEINGGNSSFFKRHAKNANRDYETAAELMEGQREIFNRSAENFSNTTQKLKEQIKRTTGDIRKAADDLASGLLKVEKQANFSNLERYVNLLERTATAMQILAELEKAGKLEKIAGALK